jgi:hypothetical protein
LTQESQVIFEEQADVRNAVLSHGQPFYPETERPAGIFFAVYPNDVTPLPSLALRLFSYALPLLLL